MRILSSIGFHVLEDKWESTTVLEEKLANCKLRIHDELFEWMARLDAIYAGFIELQENRRVTRR